jgi:PHD/YefM family antitoxin component YafN of YafNO toxin-antitoxin module
MRTMEAVDVNKDVDKVLRYIEKNRKPILVLKNGKKNCMMLPVGRVRQDATSVAATRTKKVRRDSGQAPVG